MSGFKTGANKMDQLKIASMDAEGATAEQISQSLKIKIECVKGWLPKKKRKPKTTEA